MNKKLQPDRNECENGGRVKMSYQKSYFLLHTGLIGGAVVVFIGLNLSMKIGFLGSVVAFTGLAAMLGGIAQALIFCRCPKCGTLLKIRGKRPNCCHGCGDKLEL